MAIDADADEALARAVSTAIGAHLAVGVGTAVLVVVLGLLSRPMFGSRDSIAPVYLVDGEVLIHALPALALAFAAGTGVYVASRLRATGALPDSGDVRGFAGSVVPPSSIAAGLGTGALTVFVVGTSALLLDPYLSFRVTNFLLATVALAVCAAITAALAAVATGVVLGQNALRSSSSS